MEGIVGGLGAAVMWGVSAMLSSRSTKVVGGPGAAGLVHLIGIALIVVLCLTTPPGDGIAGTDVAWALAAGVGTVVGSTLLILGVQHGKVGVVTPIVSASGALSAVAAILLGEQVASATLVLLAVVAVGVLVVAAGGEAAVSRAPSRAGTAALMLACGSCAGYALSGLGTGKAGLAIALPWVILPSRVLGFATVTVPLLVRRRLHAPRGVLVLVAGAAVLDVAGYLAYAWGMRSGIAVPSVLASLFAAVAVIGAWLVFRERLTRPQTAGIALILVGVAGLTLAGS